MSDELDHRLILMVENNPHLYDKRLPGYKDKIFCNNSWKSIGDRLNISSEDIMQIHHRRLIRTFFRKDLTTKLTAVRIKENLNNSNFSISYILFCKKIICWKA